jgi:hypothetical protein
MMQECLILVYSEFGTGHHLYRPIFENILPIHELNVRPNLASRLNDVRLNHN